MAVNGGRGDTAAREERQGFALVAVLVVLVSLYLVATGAFLAARAELRIGVSHTASSQAFYLADSGLATWFALTVQPSVADFEIGRDTVRVRATLLLRVDSVTVVYRVTSRAEVGTGTAADPGVARRELSRLGVRIGSDPVRRVRHTWSETL